MIRAVPRPARTIAIVMLLSAAILVASGCGNGGRKVNSRGAQLFAERCAGCHTLTPAGTQGSAAGERPTGPNLDKRKLSKEEALFAIRNGGFSGAIMPQNVVVGADAKLLAAYVAKNAGSKAKAPPSPNSAGQSPSGGSAGQ
jgi:mono/diheme cytochrome c family protein